MTVQQYHDRYIQLSKAGEYADAIALLEEAVREYPEHEAFWLTSLGVAYHKQRNLGKALELYRCSAAMEPSVEPFWNMALVFQDPEISQDADAADACRRVLDFDAKHEAAKNALMRTTAKLVPLAERARQSVSDLDQCEQLFEFYVSPFEALQIDDIDLVEDSKAVQRKRKLLLHELQVNDGKVSWLDDFPLDKSVAFAFDDELRDASRARFHWEVFQNKQLLSFLTRGDVDHFLYSDGYFPQSSLDLLDEDPDFLDFLSKPFARQYNRVLTRAIEHRLLAVVEVLFDGRRWVKPEDDDTCFAGAFERVEGFVDEMKQKAAAGATRKISFQDVEGFLNQRSLIQTFNLLPIAFASMQVAFVESLLSLAVGCFNQHGDAQLAHQMLGLCKLFKVRNIALSKRIDDNLRTASEHIIEQLRSKRSWEGRQGTSKRSAVLAPAGSLPLSGGNTSTDPAAPIEGRNIAQAVRSAVVITIAIVGTLVVVGATVWNHVSPPPAPHAATPPASGIRSVSPANFPGAPIGETGASFRVPASLSAELDRDSAIIDAEKAKAALLAEQLRSLSEEIARKERFVDATSQASVDDFNRSVNRYNALILTARAQNAHMNALVDAYNNKLNRYGR